MKLTVYNLTVNGTDTLTFTSREKAETDYIDLINTHLEDCEIPLADTFEEARAKYDRICDKSCINSISINEQIIELGPKPPAPGLIRFYVTITWDNFPESGSYGDVVWAKDHRDAEEKVKQNMASVRCEGYNPADYGCSTEGQMLRQFHRAHEHDWQVIDCFPLDEFIARQLAA